jgi:protein-tyrosine phosphatase
MKKLIIAFALCLPSFVYAQLADSSQRLVHMQGAVNFRDIGGYKTKEGKEVKWGKVYRSASIAKLTDSDMGIMESKHIHTVIDFRGHSESAAAPDRLLPNTDYTLSPAGSDSLPDIKKMATLMKQGDFLGKLYGDEGVVYFGERYKPLFQKLLKASDTEAVLYHCTGGRDRTGMATALFLYTLGVPEQTIEADFTASNTYLGNTMNSFMEPLSQATGMSVADIKKQMDLRPELIQTFFAAIKNKYGSIENFMEKEMGIGKKEVAILKKKYTV